MHRRPGGGVAPIGAATLLRMVHVPHLPWLVGGLGAAGVAVLVLAPRLSRAEKRRRARSQMPKWPHDFPLRKTYLSRKRPPGPVSTFSIRAELAKLKPSERDTATILRTILRALPHRARDIAVELPATVYWGMQRLGWSKSGGYIAARTSRQMFGSGAFRLGILVPENWFERRYPMQVWIPRDEIFRHLGVIGPTGAGKTTTLSLAIPWIAATSGQSIFMNDVKEPCEFFPWLVDWWRSWGRETINFAPHTPDESLCCELLHSARRDELDIIAEALLAADGGQETGGGGGGNKFFDDAGKQFFAGLMRMMRFAPRRYCTLPALFKIVAMGGKALVEFAVKLESYMPEVPQIGTPPSSDGKWASETERLKWEEVRDACRAVVAAAPAALEADGVETRTNRGTRSNAALATALAVVDRSGYEIHCWIREARAAIWRDAVHERDVDAPLDIASPAWREREAELERLWRARVREWRDLMGTLGTTFRQPETTFENIVMATQNSLKMFADEMVATAFSHPEFDFRSVADRPTLFTVGAPLSRGPAGKFVGSVYSKLVLNTVFSRRHKSPDVGLVMEEAPTLKDKDLPQTLSTVRSNGGAVIVIAQSDTQWKGLLGELAGTVNENLVNQIALKGTAGDTAKRIAERFGVAPIEKKSRNTNHGGESSGGSTGTSIEMVERLRVNDVTDVMVNGTSLGRLGALSFGTAVEPFFFTLLQYWNDGVMVETLNCTPNSRGELKPRENHHPYHRVKRTRVALRRHPDGSPVLTPVADASGVERMVPQYDEVVGPDGVPQLDPHAVDPLRDTIDFIEPPERPTYYEMTPVTLDVDDLVVLGITPPSAKALQELQERREAAAKKGAKNKGGDAHAPATPAPAGDPAAASSANAVTGTVRSWGWLYQGIVALDSSYPIRNPAMPWVEWDEGRRGWAEIAQMTRAARETGPTGGPPVVVRPSVQGESLVPLSETEVAAPLAMYLFLSAHVALDFVSWTNQHLRRAGYATQPPVATRQVLTDVLTELDEACSGIQAPEALFDLWASSGAAIAAPLRLAMDNALEDVRDRLGEATSAPELARRWAAARARWYELAGEPTTPRTPDVAWRFALAEAITDFGALSRATFLDFRALTDPAVYPDDRLRGLLVDQAPRIDFQAKRALLADIDADLAGAPQPANGPGRSALAELIASPAAAAGFQWLTADQTPVVSRLEEHVRITKKSNAA